MHSKGLRLVSRMTVPMYRRWVVFCIEKTIKYGTAMVVMGAGCVGVALLIGKCLEFLGVAYG